MDYSQYGYAYPPGSAAPPQYPDPYAAPNPAQQYQPTPPQIRNPFAPPPPPPANHSGANPYGHNNAQYDPEYEAQIAQWASAYAPAGEQAQQADGRGKREKGANPNLTALGSRGGAAPAPAPGVAAESGPTGVDGKPVAAAAATAAEEDEKKGQTVVRKGGGQTWEDTSLLEWDPTQFRIMVGNLAGEVTDDSLAKAFGAYGVSKARVVRDKRTTKSRGYGFVAFLDGELGFKAAREMSGKYIGSHPVTVQRAKTDVKPVVVKGKDGKGGKNQKGRGGRQQREKEGASAGGKGDDVLKAHTGAGVDKKGKNEKGYKVLG